MIERTGEGYDRVIAAVSYTLGAAAEIELMVTSDDADTSLIDLIGNGFDNYLYANAGRNFLDGQGGNDLIEGLGGDDILTGGLGLDTTDGGQGQDWHFVDNAGDVVIERTGEGYDRVIASTSYTLGPMPRSN